MLCHVSGQLKRKTLVRGRQECKVSVTIHYLCRRFFWGVADQCQDLTLLLVSSKDSSQMEINFDREICIFLGV